VESSGRLIYFRNFPRKNEFIRETIAKFHFSFLYLCSLDIKGRNNFNSHVQAASIILKKQLNRADETKKTNKCIDAESVHEITVLDVEII
jgi:hypothetical protein